ncbi:5059_t:CDS:2 [Cetraspora pellucida]|uniref:5059_t:CDS:1 n=1 Tax=Cetraspora pellucida TaxID=1433469 RepID=A0A9N9ADS7_9GLOM|nr:5059_t:CDS:2 [Cetraspora pellucida]
MKKISFTATYFFIYLSFIIITKIYASLQCIDYLNPLNLRDKILVPCPHVRSNKIEVRDNNNLEDESKNMFDLTFNCNLNDEKMCKKAKSTFESAGRILSSVLSLNTKIGLNATFRPLEGNLLGAAGPSRTIPFRDDDGKIRLYAQSLAKQFQLEVHPEYSSVDILADFNSNIPFWFEGDPPIQPNQTGFEELVLHELTHGLGFLSSWSNDYLEESSSFLTPNIDGIVSNVGDNIESKSILIFRGFIENAFDKYMILTSNRTHTTELTSELDKFRDGQDRKFTSINEFNEKFKSSPQFNIAKQMYKTCIKSNSIGFLSNTSNINNNAVILETGINPFRGGASLSHIDEKLFNSSDFLMTFEQLPGRTLEDSINASGSKGGKEKAIGPRTLAILETLGLIFPQSSSTESCSSSHCTKANSSPDSNMDDLSSSSNNLSVFNMASMVIFIFGVSLFNVVM